MIRCNRGIGLVEILIAVLLLTIFMAGGYAVLNAGRAAWFTTETHISLEESVRKSLDRLTTELRQSNVAHLQIQQGTGPNASDVLLFSVPVFCEEGGSLIDASGNVAHWGAPLTWGCTQSTCMDADDDCSTVDYATLEYGIGNGNQVVRRVLAADGHVVREDVLAENVTDFQLQLTGSVVQIVVTVRQKNAVARQQSSAVTVNVYLRN